MKLDVIIPARDESDTIYDVARAFCDHPDICCVNVVIDSDDLGDTVQNLPLSYDKLHVRMPPLRGKGQLITHALDYVATDRVILCDSDLKNLQAHHIDFLTQNNRPGIIIGVPDYPGDMDLDPTKGKDIKAINSWPWVSGERSLPTALIRGVELHGYLVEVQINKLAQLAGLPVWHERLNGLKSPWRMTARRLWEMERDREWGRKKGILP